MKTTVGLLLCVFVSVSLAGYSDGYITTGEYEYFVEWTSNTQPLIVEGGGANSIGMGSNTRLEVRSTSTPINDDWHTGGITNIWLGGHLDYFGGITEEITIVANATADLYGGRIDAITSMQWVGWHGDTYWGEPHINIYCQPGWSYIFENNKMFITGVWGSGGNTPNDPFTIELIDDADYDPILDNLTIITPEPASLALLAFGTLLLKRKK